MSHHYLKRKKTFHVLHLIISIICFPWVIVWVICHKSNERYNQEIDIIEHLAVREFEAGKDRNNIHNRSVLKRATPVKVGG